MKICKQVRQRLPIASLCAAIFLLWGFAMGRYEVFPFPQLLAIKFRLFPPDPQDRADIARSPDWNMKVSHFKALATSPAIVMFGDSITAGGKWHELFPKVSIINRGIEGDTTGGLLARVEEVDARNPKAVFLLIGINDLRRGEPVIAVARRYERLVVGLADADTTVIVQSTLFPGGNPSDLHQSVAELNIQLQAMCDRLNLDFVDLNQILAPNGILKPEYTLDDLHLNGDGYAAWTNLINPIVKRVGNDL